MSYRQGPWIRAWANFISSIYGKSMRKKIFVGVDKLGNRFYEYEKTRLNVKRGFEPPEGVKNSQVFSPEWHSWLNNTRRFPPSDKEILINEQRNQAQLQQELYQDGKTERRAPTVGSKGKGAADNDRTINFPTYKDIEIAAGVKLPQKPKEKE